VRAFGGGEIMIFYFIFLRGLGRGGFVGVQIGGGGGRVCFFLSRAGGFKPLIYIYILVGGGFRGYLGIQVFMSTFEFFS
jgi:hypothetical protein